MDEPIVVQVEAAEDDQFDLDELTEALSTVALIDEQRFDEIAEKVTECQNRLETISTRLAENPESSLLTQLLATVTDLRSDQAKVMVELENLKSSLSTLRQFDSEPTVVSVPPIPQTDSSVPDAAPSTEEPVPVEVPPMEEPPRRKRRVNLL